MGPHWARGQHVVAWRHARSLGASLWSTNVDVAPYVLPFLSLSFAFSDSTVAQSRSGRIRTWGLRTPAILASMRTGGGCRARSGRQSCSDDLAHVHDAKNGLVACLGVDDNDDHDDDHDLLFMPLFFLFLRTTRNTDTHIISIKLGYLAFTLIVDDDSSFLFAWL